MSKTAKGTRSASKERKWGRNVGDPSKPHGGGGKGSGKKGRKEKN